MNAKDIMMSAWSVVAVTSVVTAAVCFRRRSKNRQEDQLRKKRSEQRRRLPSPGNTCVICLDEFNASIEILPCGHIFHKDCLAKCLQRKDTSCPVCRYSLKPEEVKEYRERLESRTMLEPLTKEMSIEQVEVHFQKSDAKWDDIVGLDSVKEMLMNTVTFVNKFPDLFKNREPGTRYLLFGPTGVGKSHLVKAFASEAKCAFFSVSASDLLSKYVGDSQKMVKILFEKAKRSRPSVIFIDEIDSLCGSHTDQEQRHDRRLTNELVAQIDLTRNDSKGIYIFAATNLPWHVDQALLQRFKNRIYIPLPTEEVRLAILSKTLSKLKLSLSELDLTRLAKNTERFSGADLNCLVIEASHQATSRAINASHFKMVSTMNDDKSSGNDMWVSCSPGDVGAVKMSWVDIPSGKLYQDVLLSDFELALKSTKATVGQKEVHEYQQFAECNC